MIGTKIYKSRLKTQAQLDRYTEIADWCMSNNATIIDNGNHYLVVELPEKTEDELKEEEIVQLKQRLDELSYVSEEISLGLATKEDYSSEIEEIALIHNKLYMYQ